MIEMRLSLLEMLSLLFYSELLLQRRKDITCHFGSLRDSLTIVATALSKENI